MEGSSVDNCFATILMQFTAAVFLSSGSQHITTGTATIILVQPQPPIISFHPLKQVSYDVCLAKCLGQVSFVCETFSYCYDSQECKLSSEVVDTPPEDNQLVQEADCVVISRE